jgi:mannitol/fructose-specific phosphotransferase system IIA component (Ntr-type)
VIFTANDEPTLAQLLRPETIRMNLQGKTKQEVIDELIDMLDASHLLLDKTKARAAVIERERQVSTGMEYGLAVPHGKTDAVENLVAAFGIHRNGIMFDSADKKLSSFFFMMISPITITGPHLKALRNVIRFFSPEINRKKIMDASTPDQIISIMNGLM